MVAESNVRSRNEVLEAKNEYSKLTPAQKQAWEQLAKAFGDELTTLHGLSVHDCAEAGIKAMMLEAEQLLQNPSVRKAFERFQMVCQLTKDHTVGS